MPIITLLQVIKEKGGEKKMIQLKIKKAQKMSAKRKIVAAIGAGAIFAASFLPALAATTADVSATVTSQLISVSVADGSVAYGVLDADTNQDTVTLTDTQTATNSGNVTENFSIRSSDATSGGTDWNLAATTGTDEFTHEFSVNSGVSWTAFNVDNTTYSSMSSSIAASGSDDFDLRIKTPVSSTDNDEHTITVTVQASAS